VYTLVGITIQSFHTSRQTYKNQVIQPQKQQILQAMAFFFDDDDTAIPNMPPPGVGAHPPSPPRTYQICLMVNGHFTDNKNDVYDSFYNWLQASLPKGSNVKFQLDPYEVQEKKYPLRTEIDKYDVVVLSGSRMSFD